MCTARSVTRVCSCSRFKRISSSQASPTQTSRTRAANARNADTASSSHRSDIHIEAGTITAVTGAIGSVSSIEPTHTQTPEIRPYTNLYWAISSQVSHIGPVRLNRETAMNVVMNTGNQSKRPGMEMEKRKIDQASRTRILYTMTWRERGRRIRSSFIPHRTSLS